MSYKGKEMLKIKNKKDYVKIKRSGSRGIKYPTKKLLVHCNRRHLQIVCPLILHMRSKQQKYIKNTMIFYTVSRPLAHVPLEADSQSIKNCI